MPPPATNLRPEREEGESIAQRSARFLDWPEVLQQLAGEARSQRGRDACRSLRLADSADEARDRLAEVAELAAFIRGRGDLPGLDFPDVEPSVAAAERGILLGPDDVRPIATLCEIAGSVQRRFGAGGDAAPDAGASARPAPATPLAAALTADLDPCRPLAARIRETFDSAGEIRDAVSPELARLRREREGLSLRVRTEIEELMHADDYASVMQDQFWTVRGDRYVLPLRASAKSLGLGIVHDTSRTGETVFVEPTAVVALNNRLKLADLDVAREIRRILEELTGEVADAAPALRANLDILALVDVVAAKARFSVRFDGHPYTIAGAAVIDLRAARHPLLTLRAAREGFPVVGNDLRLAGDPAKALIISGPNAGGKTVLLKTMGLAALMARAGLLVPAAPGGRIGFFDLVFADIGDQQSVMGDLSTFSAHLANIGGMLRETSQGTDARSLVLLDELMAGTNPEQGAALARATVETLADLPGLAVVTTHYDALKALADDDPRFRNAGMEYDVERLTPTFRLKEGAPGRSYAFDIAARMGLPATLIERASHLAGDASMGLEQVIASLEAREAALAREAEQLADARASLERREVEERALLVTLERRERELARHSRAAIEAEVREGREALRAIVRQAQQAGSSRAAEEARVALSAAAEVALARFPADVPAAPTGPPPLQVGARVHVPSLGAEGRVVSPPDARGRVRVSVGSLSLELDAAELGLPSGPGGAERTTRAAPSAVRGAGALPPPAESSDALAHARPTPACTLDLRGQRADDVIEAVESFLDRAALDGRSPVFVIHGHGTGALKKIVRDYVGRSAYVRRWSVGGKGQGGDGVTVIDL